MVAQNHAQSGAAARLVNCYGGRDPKSPFLNVMVGLRSTCGWWAQPRFHGVDKCRTTTTRISLSSEAPRGGDVYVDLSAASQEPGPSTTYRKPANRCHRFRHTRNRSCILRWHKPGVSPTMMLALVCSGYRKGILCEKHRRTVGR